MKILTAFFLLAGIAGAQDKPAAKKAVSQPADVTIPAGAVQTEDGSYRAVDKQGKAWIYRKTPFGVAKSAEKPATAPQAPQEDTSTKATVNGDNVHFEKPTPFGMTKWDKKMADLDANEQRIVNRQNIVDRQKTKQQ